MNYFLDTNIVIILYEGRYTELKSPIMRILEDSQNLFYVSSISLLEIAQLYRKKKFKHIDYDLLDTGDKLIRAILNTIPIIKVLPFKEEHALIASTLTFVPKLIVTMLMLVLTGSWMMTSLSEFTTELFSGFGDYIYEGTGFIGYFSILL